MQGKNIKICYIAMHWCFAIFGMPQLYCTFIFLCVSPNESCTTSISISLHVHTLFKVLCC